MYIGAGIFLLVVGAILAFAVSDTEIGGLDLAAVGWTCMAGGIIAIGLSLLMTQRARRAPGVRTTEYVERRDIGGPPTY